MESVLTGATTTTYEISPKDVTPDIELYVEGKLTNKLASNLQDFKKEFAEELAQEVDGMFLMARLQANRIQPGYDTKHTVRGLINNPHNLVKHTKGRCGT